MPTFFYSLHIENTNKSPLSFRCIFDAPGPSISDKKSTGPSFFGLLFGQGRGVGSKKQFFTMIDWLVRHNASDRKCNSCNVFSYYWVTYLRPRSVTV